MIEEGLVSIIILSYKNLEGIFDTLNSVMKQDYSLIEVIFADDGSPNFASVEDRIKTSIAGSSFKRAIVLHSTENKGTVKNVNGALKEAKGEFIKLLAAEDMLAGTSAISEYVSFVRETGSLLVFGGMVGITPEGEIRKNLVSCESNIDLLKSYDVKKQRDRLFARNYLPAPAAFFRREVFSQYGLFDEDIRLIEDYPYWIMLSNNGVKFGYLDKTEAIARLSGVSSAGTYSEMFMQDMMVIYRKYIFPYDQRYGVFQKPYNCLKRMGLRFYMEKARLPKYKGARRIVYYLLYWPFIMYTGWINWKNARKNR
ncbi:MAG: glycosyltransferase [Lachnospiraceae bacterium]|nr:glycosyltransferase [Lachnospiraceae bacterium]